MSASVNRRLGDKKPRTLEQFLEIYISAPRNIRLFSAFSLSICDDDFRDDRILIPTEEDPFWTCAILFVDAVINQPQATRIMREIDEGLNEQLSPEEKPYRLAYRICDDANTEYLAKSSRIHGQLPAGAGRPRLYASQDDPRDDPNWVPTRPATPTEGDDDETQYVIIDLEADRQLSLAASQLMALVESDRANV